MIYSVWDQGSGDFEYFEDGVAQTELNVGKPDHLRERALGSTVGQAAWPLPAAARRVGRGPAPVGRVASTGGGDDLAGDLLGVDSSTVKMILLAVAGVLAWKTLEPRKRTP